MRKYLSFITMILSGVVILNAQSFSNGFSLLPNEYHSGGCVGFTDMDGDGFDDLIVMDQSNTLHILYQGPDGSFVDYDLGSVSGSSQWGMCVADFDNDGHKDVFSGGSYDGVHVQHITSPGVYTSMELENGSMYMQACNWADINNDGYLDVFGCHDDGLSRMWAGSSNGTLIPAPGLIPLDNYLLADYAGNDHSGNYGTVFTDFDNDGDIDLFIAKCRQFINDPYDPRRVNQLWVNDGNGNFTEEANERGLVFYEQSWTVDFADIDNDGDFDCLITNHSTTLYLFENDGLGYFTNITEGSGLDVEGFFLQAKMEDFDNDGYVDLVHSGGSHRYFHNNGDKTFTEVGGTFPGDDTMHSFAFGDVNRDGTVDLYASYGGGYVTPDNEHEDILWINDGNDNHWITFELEGFQSNLDAVGAHVIITGDFGTQIREVRAGESYGITCTFSCHFGLGLSEYVETAVITWPSGLETIIENPEIDQYHVVNEAPCLIDVAITTSEYGFCPGDSVTITAPAGFVSYQWTNDVSGTNEIVVSESGNISVMVFNEEGCAGSSNIVSVIEIVGDAPTVVIDGDLNLCDGAAITMTASEADSWFWSNSEVTQSISVTESGTYSVSVVDICANAGNSEEYTVVVYDSPVSPPTVLDFTINSGDQASFTANDGLNINWYDALVDGNLLGSGDTYIVSDVTEELTVWVSSSHITSGELVVGGELDTQEGGQYHSNSNRWLEFDVNEDVLLRSVTVYANGAYDRTFELIDEFENVLASTTLFVEDGEFTVELNFEVLAGVNYGLRTATGDPQLWREGTDSELNYPYDLGGLGAITNSTAGPEFSYYYFFYNWQVEPLPIACESERVSITASITGLFELDLIALEMYPNPALRNGSVMISNMPVEPCEVVITDVMGRVVNIVNSAVISLTDMATGSYLVTVRRLADDMVLGTSRLVVQ
jgi:hypothetical protein